jgi:signal transduction histidine kinase
MQYDRNATGLEIVRYLLMAVEAGIFLCVILIITYISSADLVISFLYVLIPLLNVLLALKIYAAYGDFAIRRVSLAIAMLFSIGGAMNAVSLLLPMAYDVPWAGRLNMVGWIAGYCFVAFTLADIRKAHKLRCPAFLELLINISGILLVVCVLSFVFAGNLNGNPYLIEICIQVLSIIVDIYIIMVCSKLVCSDMDIVMKYLILTILIFYVVFAFGDGVLLSDYLIRQLPAMPEEILYCLAVVFVTIALLVITNEDFKTHALSELNRQIKDDKMFMDELMSQSTVPVCICDVEGKAVKVNDLYLKAYPLEDLVGFDMFGHISAYQASALETLKAKKSVVIDRLMMTDIKGNVAYRNYKIFATYSSSGDVSGYVMIIDDDTVQATLEIELKKAYEDLKKEYARKVELTDMLARDLMAPMVPIIMNSSMIREKAEDPDIREYLRIVERNAYREKAIIDMIMELSTLDSGEAMLSISQFDVAAFIEENVENYRALDRSITFEVSPAGLNIRTDRDKLSHVLDNLLSNAVKYSPEGSSIQIKAEKIAERCTFSVTDHGEGITEDEIPHIFERFYIVGGSKDTRICNRTGLGLAIVKSCVELMGGNIRVESCPGKGSIFSFIIFDEEKDDAYI